MNNFYNGYTGLQQGVSSVSYSNLDNGLNSLGYGWDGLFGMAATCYPACNKWINYDGICGEELFQLTNDVTFAQDGTQIHFYNLDMTSAVHSVIGNYPSSYYQNSYTTQGWQNFGTAVGQMQYYMWN